MRYRTLLFTTPALAMAMTLAACGSEQASSGREDRPSATTSVKPSSPAAQLTVQVRESAKASPKTWTLTCDPAGGDHPKAAEACQALTKVQDPFKAVSSQQMCTQIYGGPQEATVKGTWNGKQIDTKFTRRNGCEMHRWDQVSALFGDVVKRN
jgi:hypothetical protein